MKKIKSLVLLSCILGSLNLASAGVLSDVVRVDVGKSQSSLLLDQIGDSFATIISIPDLRLVNSNPVEVNVQISINSIDFPAALSAEPAVVPQSSNVISYDESVLIPANGTYRFNFMSLFSMESLQNGELCDSNLVELFQSFKADLKLEEIPNGNEIADIKNCVTKNFSITVTWPESTPGRGRVAVNVIPLMGLTSSSMAVVADYTSDELQGQYQEHMTSVLLGTPNLYVAKSSSTGYSIIK